MLPIDVLSLRKSTEKIQAYLRQANATRTGSLIDHASAIPEYSSLLGDHIAEDVNTYTTTHALVETSARGLLYSMLDDTAIDKPSFIRIWNLLDIINILGDLGKCEPALFFWLIEELLDSQTIDGCVRVFDYLESRRERVVAKDFAKKNLVILRACNELLRRLSRADNAVFCGRVFIFLFQSFPLGDRSSVNLRGEFHVENSTNFEESGADGIETRTSPETSDVKMILTDTIEQTSDADVEQTGDATVATTARASNNSIDQLYAIFWELQSSFSNPPKLFEKTAFDAFREGLEATVKKFKEVPKVTQNLSAGEVSRKRKREQEFDDLSNSHTSNFNPKYLTSRDLFKLELSDLTFQRNILVQALILIDYLLSLSEKSKKKTKDDKQVENLNKAVLYTYTLNETDAEWALNMRNNIALYLQEGLDGKFFYRMVDTVLSRDKNWVRWKLESCPQITGPSVEAEEHSRAQKELAKAFAKKRLRAAPLGSLDLSFLSDAEGSKVLEGLKKTQRYALPTPQSLNAEVNAYQLDLDMTSAAEDRTMLKDTILSKTWRMLRVVSKSNLAILDELGEGRQLDDYMVPQIGSMEVRALAEGAD